MRKILGIISALPVIAIVSCSSSNKVNEVFISSVHDGDTFTDSTSVIYRLFGVDTPEVSNQYKSFVPTEGLEAIYGAKATKFTKGLIENRNVVANIKKIDLYDRSVASIRIGNLDLAIELLKHGLARIAYISLKPNSIYFTEDHKYYKQLLNAQHEAYEKHIGVWADLSKFKIIFPKS